MPLIDELTENVRVITRQVYVAGQPVEPISITIDLGYDVVSASASVEVAAVPAASDFRQELEIWLGWNGFTISTFKGYIEDDGRGYFPFANTIRAAGFNKRTQAKYPDAVTYSSQTDTAIVDDLLSRAGITNRSVDGAGTTLGTVQAVALLAGTPTWDLINQIDQVFGYRTFDTSDGFVRRMLISGLPAETAAFTFTEGTNILSIERRQGNVDDINNRVNVYGLPQATITWPTTRQAINALVPNPPQYIAFDFRSDLVETTSVASTVAQRLMAEVNGIPDEITLETWGHPFIQPGMTVGITSAQVGLSTQTNYWVKHVTHQIDANGFYTRITCERRIGDLGEEVGKNPIAAFNYRITQETYDIGGTQTLRYTVTCDGSTSWDPDGSPSSLTYSWSNNKNADTGTASRYSTAFSQSDMDSATAPTITLTVTDATSRSGSITKTIDIDVDAINTRALFVAASERAEATPDGGATWNTWTPAAGTVVSTAEIANGFGLFGLSNGKLMYSADYLATAPTEAVDFGSQINCIWHHEINPDRVLVGLANGQLRATDNMTAVATSTWTTLQTFAAAVQWVVEGTDGLIRVCMSNQVLVSYDGGANFGEEINFGVGATAKRLALSNFASYGSGQGLGQGNVKRLSDGADTSGTSGTTAVLGLTHHIRDDILYAGGTGGKTYIKQASTLQFATQGDLPASSSGINHMVRDGDNQMILYAAADGSLAKSFNGGSTWVKLRDYTSLSLDGLMVGYESLSQVNQTADGRRVVIAGVADLVPKVAYTDNIHTASPNWVASTAGLPVGATHVSKLRLDPFDPSNTAYLQIDGQLYKNTNYRGGGSWTTMRDFTTGGAGTSSIRDVQLTIATSGLIYVLQQESSGFKIWHSHDAAVTWHGELAIDGNNAAAGEASGPGHIMAISQHTGHDKVYVALGHTGPLGEHHGMRSTDGGHTLAGRFFATGGDHWDQAFMPYAGNSSDEIVYAREVGTPFSVLKSTDAGANGTTTPVSGIGVDRTFISANNNRLWWSITYNSQQIWKSTDSGGNWTQSTAPLLIRDAVLLRDERWYIAGSTGIFTSTNLATYATRTGNAITGVFAATTPTIMALQVDFQS